MKDVLPFENSKEILQGCKICGSAEEVEGDFMVYQASSKSNTDFSGSYQTTKTITNFTNIKPFIFRACLECTRTKLLAGLKFAKKANWAILCIIIIGLGFGIYGVNVFPVSTVTSAWRMAASISLAIGIIAIIVEFLVLGELYTCWNLLVGFPTDRVKITEAILKIFKKEIFLYAQSLNPAVYKFIAGGSRNFFVDTQKKWQEENATKEIILPK